MINYAVKFKASLEPFVDKSFMSPVIDGQWNWKQNTKVKTQQVSNS